MARPFRPDRPHGEAERGPISFTLAHLSDLHVTPIRVRRFSDLANKRVLGWLSWLRKRRHEHRGEILEALLQDLDGTAPDHVAVTGDLTNVGLAEEIAEAVPWLERLGGPEHVSIVPGNHDAYAAPVGADRFAQWAPYLSPKQASSTPEGEDGLVFPYLRRTGPLALIGLCSAVPTAPGLAVGRLDAGQLDRLGTLLAETRDTAACRVVLIHHPPVPAGQSGRRRLEDAGALRETLARHGAELVLHGHTHRTSFEQVDGPERPIPVVGVPSSSAFGHDPERRARYHLYRFEDDGAGFRVHCGVRVLDRERLVFESGPEHRL